MPEMWEAWAQSLGWEDSPGEGKVHPLQYLARESHGLYSPAAAKSLLQLCRNLCDPIDSSPSGSQVPGILQAKNTGVGCHFLQWMKGKVKWSRGVMSNSSQPHDCSLPGFSVHRIFQARVLEWGAMAFSNCIVRGVTKSQTLLSNFHFQHST